MKRGSQQRFIHLDAESAENRYRLEPADYLSPEKIFDARWAVALLGHSMVQLADEYHSKDKESLFEALKDFVGIGNENVGGSYDEAAKALLVLCPFFLEHQKFGFNKRIWDGLDLIFGQNPHVNVDNE